MACRNGYSHKSDKKKDETVIIFSRTGSGGALKIGSLPSGKNIQLAVYDLAGRKIISFQQIQSGQTYRFRLPAKGIFIYRLTGTNFADTGKFHY